MKFFFSSLILLNAFVVYGQQTVLERKAIAEKGIQKIIETRFFYEKGKEKKEGKKWAYHVYDTSGNHLIHGRFNTNQLGYVMYKREYDQQNQPIKRTWYCDYNDAFPNGKPCLVFNHYEFDEYGNVKLELGFNMEGDSVAKVVFVRDSEGQILERWDHLYMNPDNSKYYIYGYDDKGNTTKVITHNSTTNQVLDHKIHKYKYNREGAIKEIKTFNQYDEFISMSIFNYDKKGNKTEEVKYNRSRKPYLKINFSYEFF